MRTSRRLLRPPLVNNGKRKPNILYDFFKTEVRRIMSEMGYDFFNPCVLGKGEGILAPLESVTRKVMEETWFTTDQGLYNFSGLGYLPTHSDMSCSESEGSSFFENGTYEELNSRQSHGFSIMASSDNEEELARVRELLRHETSYPDDCSMLRTSKTRMGHSLLLQPAKNKNNEILY